MRELALASRGRPRAHRTPAAKEARMVDTGLEVDGLEEKELGGNQLLEGVRNPPNSPDSGKMYKGKKAEHVDPASIIGKYSLV